MVWQKEIEELKRRQERAMQMGGPEGIARQRERGKLTVRERIDLLLDKGSFEEIGMIAGRPEYDETGKLINFDTDVNIVGFGKVNGNLVIVWGQDFTVHGGANYRLIGGKTHWIERLALDYHAPLVRLLDSGGTRVQPPDPRGYSYVPTSLQNVSPAELMSKLPVVSAVLGTCAGWVAVDAAQAHWSVMTKYTSELFVAGPPVVERALGTKLTREELGNYKIHAYSGVIDNVAEDEPDAFRQIRAFLSYLPQNTWHQPPRMQTGDDPGRRDEELLSIVPRDPRKTFDVRQVIRHIVDRDSMFEMTPYYGRALVTALARLDGYPVAVMCNDARWDGGAQTASACEKMTRFIDFADTFHLPIVYLVDVPGFMIGLESEKEGALRKAARCVHARDQCTVPWFSVLIRRCFGVAGGLHSNFHRQHIRLAWPSGQWGSIPIAGGVLAAYRKEIEAAPDPEAKRLEIERILTEVKSPFRSAEVFEVEELIDPRETRPILCRLVQRAQETTATQLGPKARVGPRP